MLGIAFMELVVAEVEALGLDPRRFRAFYDEALPRVYGYCYLARALFRLLENGAPPDA
jgi:hypothetical protein